MGTMARAAADATDGLARIVYSRPPTFPALFREAADTLRAAGAETLPGQQHHGRTGTPDLALAELARLVGVPIATVRRYLDDEMRRTVPTDEIGHAAALAALAAARCLDPMSYDVRPAADRLLGTGV